MFPSHDTKAALRVELSWISALDGDAKKHSETIRQALLIADELMMSPSKKMIKAGDYHHELVEALRELREAVAAYNYPHPSEQIDKAYVRSSLALEKAGALDAQKAGE